jgi:hypothetical protein
LTFLIGPPKAIEGVTVKIAFLQHDAAVRLYDILVDSLKQYAALCCDGSARLPPVATFTGTLL